MTTSRHADALGYDAFAPFYDAFTAGSDYEAWSEHVLALARRHGLRGSRVLDVACGTGKSFIPLLRRGFKATGAQLVEADMRELPPLGDFDLITCFDDSLNHLLSESDLARAVASMGGLLGQRGLLLFDLNTLLAYRTTFAIDTVSVSEGMTFVWRGDSSPDAAPGSAATAQIEVFAPSAEGLYTRVVTRHAQRHFPPHRVTAVLARVGLDCLGVHGVLDDGAHTAEVDETRHLKVMYAAQPAKGGDPE